VAASEQCNFVNLFSDYEFQFYFLGCFSDVLYICVFPVKYLRCEQRFLYLEPVWFRTAFSEGSVIMLFFNLNS
jgi:hypothetical protein